VKRADIVKEAREWKGTKWVHQASRKGIGCDCVGLVRGVYTAVTGNPVDLSIDYTRTTHLHGKEEKLKNEISRFCDEVPLNQEREGDLLLFGFLNFPAHHIGILAGKTFIHAWEDVGRVVEIPYDAVWKRLTKAVFRMPEVED